MKMTKAEEKAGNAPAIWIELQRSTDPKRNEQCAELANAMIERLANGQRTSKFKWNDHRKCYDYGDKMGWRELTDDGHWFDLAAMAGKTK